MAIVGTFRVLGSVTLADLLCTEDPMFRAWDCVQWVRDVSRLTGIAPCAMGEDANDNCDVLPYTGDEQAIDAYAETSAPPTVRVSYAPQGASVAPSTDRNVTVAA